jgi:glycosyltransferase involved in cell wall biosynthesis/Tfp pilus assembly protein PilF
MNKVPRISILTPTFKCARYLRCCLESVLAQSYAEVEHLVVDGGSGDGTVEILREYPQIKWVSEPDNGEGEALNKALRMATGDILCWLNADDWFEPGVLALVAREIDPQKGRHILCGQANMVDEQGKLLWVKRPHPTVDLPYLLRWWRCLNHPHQPSMFFTRQVIEAVGPFNQALHFSIDLEFWLRAALKFAFFPLERPLSNARQRSDCKSVDTEPGQIQSHWQVSLPFHRHLSELEQVKFWTEYFLHRLFERKDPEQTRVVKTPAFAMGLLAAFTKVPSIPGAVEHLFPTAAERAEGRSALLAADSFQPSGAARRVLGELRRCLSAAGGEVQTHTLPPEPACRLNVPAAQGAGPVRQPGNRIMIDGVIFQLQHKAPAGISRVWTSLLRELANTELAKDIILLDRSSTAPVIPGIETRPAPGYDSQRFESDPLLLQEICDHERVGLFVSTYYTFPEQTHSMILLHDMIPEATGQDLSLPEWRAKTKAIERACAYFCVSNSTMTDFRRLHPELGGRSVYLTPNAVGDEFRRLSQAEVSAFCARFKIPKPYFLLVGHRMLYKNAQLFFRAFASWGRRADFDIVCTGGAPELERGLRSLTHDLPCHLLALSNAELAAAYSGAAALVYPSRYEGFGLPVLEAQKCGCPVITCPNSSLPEVAGQAALFVGDLDVAGLQAAMDQVLDPVVRGRLVENGFENIRRFSWTSTAASMAEAIRTELSRTRQLKPRSCEPLDTAERFAWGLARNQQQRAASQLLSYTEMALNRRSPDLAGMARLEHTLSPLLAGAHRAFKSLPDANGESDGLLCFFQGLALEHRKEFQPALKAYLKALNAMSSGLAKEFRVRLGLRLARVTLEMGDRNVCEQVLLTCVLPFDPQNADAHELLGRARAQMPAGKAGLAPAGTFPIAAPAPAAAPEHTEPAATQPSSQPRVSALVSAYKSERFMRGCLEDLENQTIAERLEIIVVDSASPQNERAIVEEFQKRYSNIVYIRTEERETLSAAWNRAIKASRGKYLTTANTDDRHRRDALEILARTLDEHPEVTLVYADCLITRAENQTFETATVANQYRWLDFNRADLLLKGCFIGPQPLWRREVHDEHGFFDPSFVTAGDYEFWLRIACTREFLHVRETLGLYLESSNSVEHANAERGAKEAAEAHARYASALLGPQGRGLRVEGRGDEAPTLDARPSPLDTRHSTLSVTVPPRQTLALPPCALLGQLGPARELLRRRKLPEAWTATRAALEARPFHPEAWLLLAEIASAAGASDPARQCAQHARQLAPEWKPARKFLQGRLRGNARPAWLVLPEPITNRPERLSVCLIARNEEQFLPRCLASVRGLADQVVLLDTGSTDHTVQLATKAGAEVYRFAWCDDFSAARNAALEHVTGDWVLVLDADEELPADSQEPLRRLMQHKPVIAWRLPIIDAGREDEGCSYVPRLFRNAPALFYVGRMHEQIFSSLEVRRKQWGLDNRLGNAPLLHHGYRPEVVKDRNKIERNLRLLERAVAEMPDEPNLLMSYGLELARSGQRERGVLEYFKAFHLMSAQPASMVVPELRETLLTQLSSQLTALKRWDELARLLNSPLAEAGGLTASLHFALGLAHLEQKQFCEAADQMRQCLAKRHQPALAPINKEIHQAGPRHCLALCLDQLRQPDAAAQEFRRALQDHPQSRPARLDYAGFQAAHGQPVQALNLYRALAKEKPDDAQAWLCGGRLALSAPQFHEVALDWTSEAERHLPGHPGAAQQRAEALTLGGQCEAALPLWRRLAASAAPPAQAQAIAAAVLCEAASGQNVSAPPAALETSVSREFVTWYQRLVRFNARTAVEALNARVEALEGAIPSAARLLAAALAQAQAARSR